MFIKEAAWSYREGSRIILSFLDVNGNQTGAAFRISGIFRTNNDLFEAMSLFVPEDELRRLTGMEEGQYHRFIARLEEDDLTNKVTPVVREALPGLEVLSWKEIQTDLAMVTDYINQIYAIFMVIILAALAFGIVNTMLMSVLERTRELGMLSAIGMNRRKIFVMIMLESIFLSIVGGFAGMAVSGGGYSHYQPNRNQPGKICGRDGGFRVLCQSLSHNRSRFLCHAYGDDRDHRDIIGDIPGPQSPAAKSGGSIKRRITTKTK